MSHGPTMCLASSFVMVVLRVQFEFIHLGKQCCQCVVTSSNGEGAVFPQEVMCFTLLGTNLFPFVRGEGPFCGSMSESVWGHSFLFALCFACGSGEPSGRKGGVLANHA